MVVLSFTSCRYHSGVAVLLKKVEGSVLLWCLEEKARSMWRGEGFIPRTTRLAVDEFGCWQDHEISF